LLLLWRFFELWLWLLFWAFWCGEILEGKRIAKGKLLKGMAKGVDRTAALRTLT
jgi:hypothetical protein